MGILTPFEGRDVLSTHVAITNAGDGLSSAMKVDPEEMHVGETRYVVLECEVAKVRFDPVKDTDGMQRVHILRAGRATMIDAAAVADALDEQEKRIEKAKGIQNLDSGALSLAHFNGEHQDGLVPGCPNCDEDALGDDDDHPDVD